MEIKPKYDILQTKHGSYKTTLTKKFLARKPWEPFNPNHIKSFIPGTVVEILVKEGQSVKEDDIIMIYKAMKMNNNIRAIADSKVKKILVQEGDSIPKGTLMIEME